MRGSRDAVGVSSISCIVPAGGRACNSQSKRKKKKQKFDFFLNFVWFSKKTCINFRWHVLGVGDRRHITLGWVIHKASSEVLKRYVNVSRSFDSPRRVPRPSKATRLAILPF